MVEREVLRLASKWKSGSGWPKRLDWIEVDGIRGWTGQRLNLSFPITAVVGVNGAGKSTLLQAAASIYAPDGPGSKARYASDFFLDTPWDTIAAAEIRCAVHEGNTQHVVTVRKPSTRWLGNPQRRRRHVEYIDLSRIQPVPARVGYTRLANRTNTEAAASPFEDGRRARFSSILGRTYDAVKIAITSADPKREVGVIDNGGAVYSGFHQGAGETTLVELLSKDFKKYSLVLIDEIESSLHPRMQRRLIRDLAEACRVNELQVVLTTHSPYVLDELPPEARAHVLMTGGEREIVYGVSPEFSMSRMDDVAHYECDVYVEDDRSAAVVTELMTAHNKQLVSRCQVIPYGAASVGKSLGQMVKKSKFPRPSCVFLDGDIGTAEGCENLPGEDAPEVVVFEALKAATWTGLAERTGRDYADVVDACEAAMSLSNHHDWIRQAGNELVLGGDTLWQAMCAQWASQVVGESEAKAAIQPIEDLLSGIYDPAS